jgi:hypothetical protein
MCIHAIVHNITSVTLFLLRLYFLLIKRQDGGFERRPRQVSSFSSSEINPGQSFQDLATRLLHKMECIDIHASYFVI